jgi:hypothetical protein
MDPTLQRRMFQGATPQATADGVGITSGLAEVAGQMDSVNKAIDSAETPEGIMNVLRGDNQSVESRRTELAGYVGKPDAKQTPESVLTLLQPTFAILDMAETTQAPRTEEASMRIAMGETPVKRFRGTNLGDPEISGIPGASTTSNVGTFSVADANRKSKKDFILNLINELGGSGQPSYEDQLARFTTAQQPLMDAYSQYAQDAQKGFRYNPLMSVLNLAGSVASAPRGQLISRVLSPEAIKGYTDPLLQMAQGTAQAEAQAKLKAAEAESNARTRAAELASKGDTTKASLLSAAIPSLLKDVDASDYKIDKITTENDEGVPITLTRVFGPNGEILNTTENVLGADWQVLDGETETIVFDKNQLGKPGYSINDQAQRIGKTLKFQYHNLQNGEVVVWDPNANNGAGKEIKRIGEPSFESKFDVVQQDGDQYLFNKKEKTYSLLKAGKGTDSIYNFGGLIVKFNDQTGDIKQMNETLGLEKVDDLTLTEAQKNINGYIQASAKLKTLTPGTKEYQDEYKKVEAFTNLLFNDDRTEFITLQEAQAKRIYESVLTTSGPDAAEAAKDKFLTESTEAYLEAKSKKSGAYNANEAIEKKAAEKLYGSLTDLEAKVRSTGTVARDSGIANELANNFRSGLFGNARATLARFTRELGLDAGITKTLKEKFNIDLGGQTLEQFLGGSAISAEALDSVGKSIAIGLAENFPGNLNREEIQIITTVGPSLGKSPEAIKLINELYKQAAERNQTLLLEASAEVKKMMEEGKNVVEIDAAITKLLVERREELNVEGLDRFKEQAEQIVGDLEARGGVTQLTEGTLRYKLGDETFTLGKNATTQFDTFRQYGTLEEILEAFENNQLSGALGSRYVPSTNPATLRQQKEFITKNFNIVTGATDIERFQP